MSTLKCRSYIFDIPFSSGESVGLTKSTCDDRPCKLLYDFNLLDKFSCCISSNVGAGLNTVFKECK